MPDAISLQQLLDSGVVITPHEAIAVVQQLLRTPWDASATRSLRLDDLMLFADGRVEHPACEEPEESEIGRLLDALLPAGTGQRVPGALRLTVARACRAVDAPPFGSIAALSAALERFERGERHAVVCGLVQRALTRPAASSEVTPAVPTPRAATQAAEASGAATPAETPERATPSGATPPPTTHAPTTPPPAMPALVAPAAVAHVPALTMPHSRPERRHPTISLSAVRRDLRIADARLFQLQRQLAAARSQLAVARSQLAAAQSERLSTQPPPMAAEPSRAPSRAAAFIAAVLLSFVAGYVAITVLGTRTSRHRAASDQIARSAPAEVPPSGTRINGEAGISPYENADLTSSDPMPDSSGPVQAVPGFAGPQFSPAFAPGGRAIYFHTGRASDARSALMFEDESRGRPAVTPIVNDGARNYHVQPSPDGRHIAFDSDRDGERGVYLANSDGTDVRRITGPGYAAVPTWAPDSRQLAFVRAEPDRPKVWNLWLLAIDTGDTRRLTGYRFGQTWGASWFADGTHICYTHEETIVVLNVETGATREYATPVAGHIVRTPAVSPQGDRVVFQVHGSGVWLLDLQSGAMRPMLDDRTAEEFAWSPDGRLVAFHSRRDGEWRIWTMSTERQGK